MSTKGTKKEDEAMVSLNIRVDYGTASLLEALRSEVQADDSSNDAIARGKVVRAILRSVLNEETRKSQDD